MGEQCEKPVACKDYCRNGGECSLRDGSPYCTCVNSFKGSQCEESRSILVPVLSALAVIVIVLVGGFFVFDYFLRNRTPFSHERLQENDFNNPIFQERDGEPFTLDADRVSINSKFINMHNLK